MVRTYWKPFTARREGVRNIYDTQNEQAQAFDFVETEFVILRFLEFFLATVESAGGGEIGAKTPRRIQRRYGKHDQSHRGVGAIPSRL